MRVYLVTLALALCLHGTTPITAQTPIPVPPSSHVFLVVLENGTYTTITDTTNPNNYMANLVGLGTTYGHATNYKTNSAGSLLAYLWLSSGFCEGTANCPAPPFPAGVTGIHNTFGCGGGSCTSPITDDNISREMNIHTPNPITWKLYAESIPSVGYMGPRLDPPDPNSSYDPHHNGPKWYSDIINSVTEQNKMVPFT